MFCPNCGTAVPSNTNSCPHCQENLSDINNVTPVKPTNNPTKAGNALAIVFAMILIFFAMIIVFASSARAEDYCGQAYQACLQARELGAYAESLGVSSGGLSSFNCSQIISECSGASYAEPLPQPEEDNYTQSDNSNNQSTTTQPVKELTPEEKEAVRQVQAEEDWLDYLNLSSGDLIVNQPIAENWVDTYYRPNRTEELGLTGKAQVAHDQFAEATQTWLDALDNELDSGTIRAFRDLMKNAKFDYMESLVNYIMSYPTDPTANHELSQIYFNEGTPDDFVIARELESRAFVNLDVLERQTLDARVKEETERNGFAQAFYNPKPEESTFITKMENEISDQFSNVKDKSVDWLKQTDAYARAETYSNEVRGFFSGFSTDIFHVDNSVINQATYGE